MYVTSRSCEKCCDRESPGAVEALRKQHGDRCQGRCPQGVIPLLSLEGWIGVSLIRGGEGVPAQSNDLGNPGLFL